jgi:hypothetical protein
MTVYIELKNTTFMEEIPHLILQFLHSSYKQAVLLQV